MHYLKKFVLVQDWSSIACNAAAKMLKNEKVFFAYFWWCGYIILASSVNAIKITHKRCEESTPMAKRHRKITAIGCIHGFGYISMWVDIDLTSSINNYSLIISL